MYRAAHRLSLRQNKTIGAYITALRRMTWFRATAHRGISLITSASISWRNGISASGETSSAWRKPNIGSYIGVSIMSIKAAMKHQ